MSRAEFQSCPKPNCVWIWSGCLQ